MSRCKECARQVAADDVLPREKKAKLQQGYCVSHTDSNTDDDIPEPSVRKPNIIFFGEWLLDNFFDHFIEKGSTSVDLVNMIRTSLKAATVSEVPNHLPKDVPYIYLA